jgi:hypothetical protein
MQASRGLVAIALGALAAGAVPLDAQLPLAVPRASGQTVTPAYEGWYRNDDGSFSLSFGYLNRNAQEVVEVPVGPDNFIAPGPQNQGQPTEFQPRRHWGVFAVRVPADFGKGEVVWTLRIRGVTYAIPGRLHPNWQIDALEGEAGAGNTPPIVRFDPNGPTARGPLGFTAGPLRATFSSPFTLSVWAGDDGRGATTTGRAAAAGRGAGPQVSLAFFKHQGPGKVTFAPATSRVPVAGGEATTNVSFTAPGEYLLRVRANDVSGVANAGHAQCCWTNGFVRVVVK